MHISNLPHNQITGAKCSIFGESSSATRVCPRCGHEKVPPEYYSKGTRLESCCKECSRLRKKEIRRERSPKRLQPLWQPPQSEVAVGTTIEVSGPGKSQCLDKLYGRELTETEKTETTNNLFHFFRQAARLKEQCLNIIEEDLKRK